MNKTIKIAAIAAVVFLVYHFFFRSITPKTSVGTNVPADKDDIMAGIVRLDLGQDLRPADITEALQPSAISPAGEARQGADNQTIFNSGNRVDIIG